VLNKKVGVFIDVIFEIASIAQSLYRMALEEMVELKI
jgi:hypothetical protein